MPPCCRQVEIDMRVDLWPYPTVALFHVRAHAEKNSETACSRVADESVRVPPRVAHSFSPIHKLTLASLKRSLNP